MEKIDLDKQDRSNIYKEYAHNVIALEASADEMLAFDSDEAFDDALTDAHKLMRNGQRRAYIIIKVSP